MKETGVRNVHAWVIGQAVNEPFLIPELMRSTRVRYDFENGRFITDRGRDITDAWFPYAIQQGANLKVLHT